MFIPSFVKKCSFSSKAEMGRMWTHNVVMLRQDYFCFYEGKITSRKMLRTRTIEMAL
jgi:hypothetical protein